MSELRALLARHCREAVTATPIPRLTLMRSNTTTQRTPALSHPQLCLIAAGRKRVYLGAQSFYYDASTYLVTSVDLPVSGQVVQAPYLGLSLAIDRATVAELVSAVPDSGEEFRPVQALTVTSLNPKLHDAMVRLVGLLEVPGDIPALAPLFEREILYHLLHGPHGEMLRQLAAPAGQLSQIRRAIAWLHRHYDRPMQVAELARIAGMSAPTFHRHFRAVANMSPLQFHKRIRLQEARRRLLEGNPGAANVAFDLGYESASQFSREYRRMFGAPPARDAMDARRAPAVR